MKKWLHINLIYNNNNSNIIWTMKLRKFIRLQNLNYKWVYKLRSIMLRMSRRFEESIELVKNGGGDTR